MRARPNTPTLLFQIAAFLSGSLLVLPAASEADVLQTDIDTTRYQECGEEPRDHKGQLMPVKESFAFPSHSNGARKLGRLVVQFDVTKHGDVVNSDLITPDEFGFLSRAVFMHLLDLKFEPCISSNRLRGYENERREYGAWFTEGRETIDLGLSFHAYDQLPEIARAMVVGARSTPVGVPPNHIYECSYKGRSLYLWRSQGGFHGEGKAYGKDGDLICQFSLGVPVQTSFCESNFFETAQCEVIWEDPRKY